MFIYLFLQNKRQGTWCGDKVDNFGVLSLLAAFKIYSFSLRYYDVKSHQREMNSPPPLFSMDQFILISEFRNMNIVNASLSMGLFLI